MHMAHLGMFILVLMKQLLGQALLLQSSNGGETLKCHGDMGVQWTSSWVRKTNKHISAVWGGGGAIRTD
jgi:hypothetical protein